MRDWLRRSQLERADAESVLCYALEKPRSYLFSHGDEPLSPQVLTKAEQASERRTSGEPLAYITGTTEFWSLPFVVTTDVLIPRDDTGCLVEVGLHLWQSVPQNGLIVDAGTGSGAVAIAFAKETGERVMAIDISQAALAVAADNAARLVPGLIHCRQANWLEGLEPQSVSLLLSNPPYIAIGDPHLDAAELTHEPESALIAGPEGLDDLRTLVQHAKTVLLPGGALALEHGYDQGESVQSIFLACGYQDISTVQDLSGNDRVTHARLA